MVGLLIGRETEVGRAIGEGTGFTGVELSCWQSSQKEMPVGNLKPKLKLRPRNKELGWGWQGS